MERLLFTDFDQGQVQFFIGSLDLALDFTTVGELDHDLVGTADHVIIGEYIAVGTDNESGPETLFTAGTLLGHLAVVLVEKFIKKIVKGRLLHAGTLQVRSRLDDLGGADINNGRLEFFCQFDKIGAGGSCC